MPKGDYFITKVPENDPRRCQAVISSKGQCLNIQVENSNFCAIHGGAGASNSADREEKRLYKVAKWQNKLNRQSDSPRIKSLREEIAVLRMMLEEKLLSCQDSHDLILQSQSISELVSKIERVVKTCHTLEGSMGQLLDKQALLQFASQIITIITEHVQDETILNALSQEILAAIPKSDA